MIILAGLGSFLRRVLRQCRPPCLPSPAPHHRHLRPAPPTAVLLFANGLGGVLGGLLLEWHRAGSRSPSGAALWSTVVYGASTCFFALRPTRTSSSASLLVVRSSSRQSRRPVQSPSPSCNSAPLEGRRARSSASTGSAPTDMRIGSGITVGFIGAPLSASAPPLGWVIPRALRLRRRPRGLPRRRRPPRPRPGRGHRRGVTMTRAHWLFDLGRRWYFSAHAGR